MRRAVLCILCFALAIFLLACAARPTRVQKNFGKSVEQAKVNQILDPEAEKNLEPVTGLDGKAAKGAIEKYRMTFEGSRLGGQLPVQTGTQALDKPIEGGGYSSGYSK